MRGNQVERGKFIEAMRVEGLSEHTSLTILRNASTIQRLAVAECNGDDWKRPNGPRHYSLPVSHPQWKAGEEAACGEQLSAADGTLGASMNAPRSTRRYSEVSCSNCLSWFAEQRIRKALPETFAPVFQGDPRGCCVKIKVPSGRTDDMGREGMCVPVPRY